MLEAISVAISEVTNTELNETIFKRDFILIINYMASYEMILQVTFHFNYLGLLQLKNFKSRLHEQFLCDNFYLLV